MWYGYNYTTSVVHKDAADNINCLVYGVKNYTMVSRDQSVSVLLLITRKRGTVTGASQYYGGWNSDRCPSLL